MEIETFYQIYNHANGDKNMFRTEDNYFYFLIRIKKEASLKTIFGSMKKDLTGFENLSGLSNS